MDSRLCVELGIDNEGNFFAVDHSPYEMWINEGDLDFNHVVYERLLLYDGLDVKVIGTYKTIATDILCFNRCRTIDLPGDGLYLYQKLVLPLKGHAGDSICYSDVDHIYVIDSEGEHIADFDEAFEIVKECRTINSFWFDDKIGCIFNLIKCYLIKVRNELNDYLKANCKGACDSKGVSDADILFIAIIILKDLLCKRDFAEFERVLNAVSRCGGLCKDLKSKPNNCGCD